MSFDFGTAKLLHVEKHEPTLFSPKNTNFLYEDYIIPSFPLKATSKYRNTGIKTFQLELLWDQNGGYNAVFINEILLVYLVHVK